jgi:hypothetical protein
VGRPTRRTPQVEADLVQALRAGNTRKAAALYAGIGENTFGDWLRRFRSDRCDLSSDLIAVMASHLTVTSSRSTCTPPLVSDKTKSGDTVIQVGESAEG